jgi:hypothetical protein
MEAGMTSIAAQVPVHADDRLTDALRSAFHRLTVLRRFWRRQRARRRYLTHVLNEVRDPTMLSDCSISHMPTSGLERWAIAMLHHWQH